MFKNSPQKSLIFKGITTFALLVGTACMLSFMNCSFNEKPIIIEQQPFSSERPQNNFPSTPTPTPPAPPAPATATTTTTTSDDCSNDAPQSQLTIVQQVAARTGNLYKTNVSQFTQRVVECLKDISSNWGRRIDSGSLSSDTVAYYIDNEDPYSVNIVDISTPSQLAWSVEGNSEDCGQVGGTWQSVSGDCVLNEVEEQCSQDQLDNDYATINEECLKKCDSFAETNAQGVTIGKGEQCNDTSNYNILSIQNTFESELDEPQSCCRRSSKRNCSSSSGYQLVVDNCQPTCAQAAKLAGYTTSHVYSNGGGGIGFNTSDCDDLKYNSHSNWEDFSFYDPYRFLQTSNTDHHISEVKPDTEKYGCCRTGSQDETPAQSYNSNGWHPDDHTD